jgi:hypothetical protein
VICEIYQGALEYKESYVKVFLEQTPETIAYGSYDVSKIEAVLDLVMAECTAIAFEQWDQDASTAVNRSINSASGRSEAMVMTESDSSTGSTGPASTQKRRGKLTGFPGEAAKRI